MSKKIDTDWNKLGISNDFLFGKIMRKPELCKELLQRIFFVLTTAPQKTE